MEQGLFSNFRQENINPIFHIIFKFFYIDAHRDCLQVKPNLTSFQVVIEEMCLEMCIFSKSKQVKY
jgi:hypothetical protein